MVFNQFNEPNRLGGLTRFMGSQSRTVQLDVYDQILLAVIDLQKLRVMQDSNSWKCYYSPCDSWILMIHKTLPTSPVKENRTVRLFLLNALNCGIESDDWWNDTDHVWYVIRSAMSHQQNEDNYFPTMNTSHSLIFVPLFLCSEQSKQFYSRYAKHINRH